MTCNGSYEAGVTVTVAGSGVVSGTDVAVGVVDTGIVWVGVCVPLANPPITVMRCIISVVKVPVILW